MKKSLHFLAIAFYFLFAIACNKNTPEEYFGRTTLNSNQAKSLGEMYRFQLKKNLDQLQTTGSDGKKLQAAKTYVEYIQKGELPKITETISAIEQLKRTPETETMIDLSLDYFDAVQKEYETDMTKMAQMVDNKDPDTAILQFAAKVDAKNQPVLIEKRGQLFAVAIPYAEKYGIKVSVSKSVIK